MGFFLWEIGAIPIPLCSNIKDKDTYLEKLDLDGFILSGGNNINDAPSRDALEEAILLYSIKYDIPVLGVCRGMQFINHFQGGSLVEAKGHIKTHHSNLIGNWAKENNILNINSYHKYVIKDDLLGNDLIKLICVDDLVIEAIQHVKYPWLGLMWHPERELPFRPYDLELIKRFFDLGI